MATKTQTPIEELSLGGLLARYNQLSGRNRKSNFKSKEEGIAAIRGLEQAVQDATRPAGGEKPADAGKPGKAQTPPLATAVPARTRVARVGRETRGVPATVAGVKSAADRAQERSERQRHVGAQKAQASGQTPSAELDRPRSRDEEQVIRVLTDANPRREGSHAHRHFEAMKGGVTVAQYLAKFRPEERRTARQWLSNTVRDKHVEIVG